MFGDGVSTVDLMLLVKAIRDKNLTLQVKILDKEWEDISGPLVKKVLETVVEGAITSGNDIRFRLFKRT